MPSRCGGFGGASILEIVEDHAGDTYRAIYTIRLAARIRFLHAFQKKSRLNLTDLSLIFAPND